MARKGKETSGKTFAGKRKLTSPPESDSKSARKKVRNPSVLQFFDCSAEVAEEEDHDNEEEEEEEEEDQDHDFLDDTGMNKREEHKSGKSHPLPFLLKEEELSDDELERLIKERYDRTSEYVVYAEECKESDIKQTLVDNPEDPTIWKVKCAVGHEREIVFCLIHKYIDLQSSVTKLQITSAFAIDHVKGFVYIEADRECDVYMACKGLRSVYANRMTLVPKNEVAHLLSTQPKSMDVFPGMWIRVMSGDYKGDLAQVVAVDDAKKKKIDAKRKATVKLIPRIDLQAIANRLAGKAFSRKATVPAPSLISSHELEKLRDHIRVKRDQQTKETFEIIGGLMLKDGFLYKKLSFESLCCRDVRPSADELRKFKAPEKVVDEDPFWLSSLFGREREDCSVKVDKVTDEALQTKGKGIKHSHGASKDAGSTPPGFGESMELPTVPESPRGKRMQNFDQFSSQPQGEGDRNFFIGQALRIRVGPLKGYLCRVIDIFRSDITVKLNSQAKVMTVNCEHLSEADAVGYKTSSSDSCQKLSDVKGKGVREDDTDAWNDKKVGDAGPEDGWGKTDSWKPPSFEDKSKFVTEASAGGWDSMEVGSGDQAGGWNNSKGVSGDQASCWGTENNIGNQVGGWNDKKVGDSEQKDGLAKTDSWEAPTVKEKSKFAGEASSSGWGSMEVGSGDQAGGWNNSKTVSGDQASCWGTENNIGNKVDGWNDKKVDSESKDGLAKTDAWEAPSFKEKSKFVGEVSTSGWGSMEVGSRDQAGAWNNSKVVSGDQASSWEAPSFKEKSKFVGEASASGLGSMEVGSRDQAGAWNNSEVVSGDQASSWGTENNIGNLAEVWGKGASGNHANNCEKAAEPSTITQAVSGNEANTWNKTEVVDKEKSVAGFQAGGGWDTATYRSDKGKVETETQVGSWDTALDSCGKATVAGGNNSDYSGKEAVATKDSWGIHGDLQNSGKGGNKCHDNWTQSKVGPSSQGDCGDQSAGTWGKTSCGSGGDQAEAWTGAKNATVDQSGVWNKSSSVNLSEGDSWKKGFDSQSGRGSWASGWEEGPSKAGSSRDGPGSWSRGKTEEGNKESCWNAKQGGDRDQSDSHERGKGFGWDQGSNWNKNTPANKEADGWNAGAGRGGSRDREEGWPRFAGRGGSDGGRDSENSWNGYGGRGGRRGRGGSDESRDPENSWNRYDGRGGRRGRGGRGGNRDQTDNWNGSKEFDGNRSSGWNNTSGRGGNRDQTGSWNESKAFDGDQSSGWSKTAGQSWRGGGGGSTDQANNWKGSKTFGGDDSFDRNKATDARDESSGPKNWSGWNTGKGSNEAGGNTDQTESWSNPKAFGMDQSSSWNKDASGDRKDDWGPSDRSDGWNKSKALEGDNTSGWNVGTTANKASVGEKSSGWNVGSGGARDQVDGWNKSETSDRANPSGSNAGTADKAVDGNNASAWDAGSGGSRDQVGGWNKSKSSEDDSSSSWNAGTTKASDWGKGSGGAAAQGGW